LTRMLKFFTLATASLLPVLGCSGPGRPDGNPNPPSGFVYPAGTHFALNGRPFYIAGANHHYLHFAPAVEIDNALRDAQSTGINALRIWAFLDIGSLDGITRETVWSKYGNSAYDLNTNGIYFQYWDSASNAVAYNDGPDGLRHLDYAVSEAGKRGFRLILSLSNNWLHMGGIPQYLEWFGLKDETDHHRFFSDVRCRTAYKNWMSHLVNRVNYYTGVRYKDDPTIMSWELMNEPEAGGAPVSVIRDWAAEMSAYLKGLDPNHLVGLGEQGYFSGRAGDWKYSGVTGVDFDQLIRIPTLDWGSYHLYPSWWSLPADWGQTTWIPEHLSVGKSVGKPVLLGEFGWNQAKDAVYQNWTRKIEGLDGAGWMFWRLIGRSQDGAYPADSDHFDVRTVDSVFNVLKEAATRITAKNN
jgi:mannan endo-1,4-beta-mannosidase